MSAIEVLKQKDDVHRIFGLEESVQILEERIRDEKLKNKKLREWLEKEIKYWEKRRIEYKDKEQYEDYMEDLALQRILSYERVLERVGEQK